MNSKKKQDAPKELSIEEERKLLNFSKSELENLAEKVGNAIKLKEAEERKGLLALIEDYARQANVGVTFHDLDSQKKVLPIQYRHPDDPTKTWRGRGLMPRWLKDEIAKGRSKEEFKI